MIFSNKKIIIAYTVEQCIKCEMLTKRKFKEGDVLFAELSKCSSCGSLTRIEKIFGESFEQ